MSHGMEPHAGISMWLDLQVCHPVEETSNCLVIKRYGYGSSMLLDYEYIFDIQRVMSWSKSEASDFGRPSMSHKLPLHPGERGKSQLLYWPIVLDHECDISWVTWV